jgi:hypothetical protein
MNLLETFDSLLANWQALFSQQRMFDCRLERRLESENRANSIVERGDDRGGRRSQQRWQMIEDGIEEPVWFPLCKKTGRHIPGVSMARDPLSPPFHVNLLRIALPAVVRLG